MDKKTLGLIIIVLGAIVTFIGVLDAYEISSAVSQARDGMNALLGREASSQLQGMMGSPSYKTPIIEIVAGLAIAAVGLVVRKSDEKA